MSDPLVSVICLCYNHERFVGEAIQSVMNQSYSNVQLVIVDDQSSDRSTESIQKILSNYPTTEFLSLKSNIGNCRAFNRGLALAQGDFIIDLSADDVLMPDRIEKGVSALQAAGLSAGVNFSDAQLIDENGQVLGLHSHRFPHQTIPQGDVYDEVLARYFIAGPTMMVRREVFDRLGGYDEELAYEDFDFWVRSSRDYCFCYTPEALVKRRVLGSSLGRKQYTPGSVQLLSTLKVCGKALTLNRNMEEHAALKKRIFYEVRQALRLGEIGIVRDYWRLWRRIPT